MWLPLRGVLICLALLVPFAAHAQEPTGDKTPQTVNSPTKVPTFYAHSRQVIVEAEVWDKTYKKGDRPWIGDEPLRPGEKVLVRRLPPPARGLIAREFHVFDNGVEQSINYFKETDFPAVDMTSQWYFVPTAEGTWRDLPLNENVEFPSATYLIGYVPLAIRPGECRPIKIVVEGRQVQVNRDHYCAINSSKVHDDDALNGTKLGTRMRQFANSSVHGSIKVSMQAFTFWSSGVLHLVTKTSPAGNAATLPASNYMYVVEVHDSKAPATVQIAVAFNPPQRSWYYPCQKDEVLHILGIVYKTDGQVAGQFADTFSCLTPTASWPKGYKPDLVYVPSMFDSQISLPPGQYDLPMVVTDGNNFGRAQMHLQVEPLNPERLTISDIMVVGVLRDASWVLREAASVSPAPVVPSPLVSKDLQFFPDADTPPHLRKHTPLFLYFEIYEPLMENEKPAVYYRVRIANLKSGSLVTNTGSMSAADWVLPGNAAIPIGLKIATDKLKKGSYRLEVQASDSVGRETEWRQATFTIE
jgi:hypothetical protein